MIKYFVSFIGNIIDGTGTANCQIEREKPIKNLNDILEIENILKKKNSGWKTITLINWRRFE